MKNLKFILSLILLSSPIFAVAQDTISIGGGKTAKLMTNEEIKLELSGKYAIYSPASTDDSGVRWYDSSDGTIGIVVDETGLNCVGDFVQMLYPGDNYNGNIAETLYHRNGKWYRYTDDDNNSHYFYLYYSSTLELMCFSYGNFIGRTTKDLGSVAGLTGVSLSYLRKDDAWVYRCNKGGQAFKKAK